MVDTTTHRIINQNSCWRFYFNFYRCSVIVNFESKKFITLTVKNINQLHGYMSCKFKFEISLFLLFDSCLKLLTNFIDEDDFSYSWHTGSRIFGICLNFKPWTVHFFFFSVSSSSDADCSSHQAFLFWEQNSENSKKMSRFSFCFCDTLI